MASRAKRPYRLAPALGAAVQSALMVSMAGAADFTWNNAGGGAYATGTNWTPNAPAGAPGSLDRSIFNLNNTYTVTFGANVVNAGFAQSQGNVTFGIGSGRSYTLNSSAFELGNTAGQTATLFVPNGTFAINASTSGIGTVAGSTGFLSVVGAASSFTSAGYCDVGIGGNGLLEIADGASATIAPGSYVGAALGSNGEIRVGGSGASANLGGSLSIGREGTGILQVVNGGTASIGPSLFVGYGSGAQGSVSLGSLSGGTVNSSGMTVGYLGTGALIISAGSTLNNSGDVNLAYNAGAVATAGVAPSSTWNQSGGSIYVGGYNLTAGGQATLDVSGTLAVTGTGNGVVIRGSGVGPNNGTLNLSSGLLSTPYLTCEPNGTFNFTGGTLQINGGTLNLSQAGLTLNSAGAGTTLIFNGPGASFATPTTTLTVGSTANGALRVLGGAQPAVVAVTAGFNATGTGTVLVSGTGSTLSTSGISFIARQGIGSLAIEDGGSYLGSSDLRIADFPGGTGAVTVSGTGSQLFCQSLNVGQSGIGTVSVTNGGFLSATQIFLGAVGGRGDLNVSGPNTFLVLSGGGLHRIIVGNSGGTPSTATFGFGATINADVIEILNGSTVNLNGATLNLFQGLTPGAGTFNFNGGTLGFTTGWVADAAQIAAVLGSSATLGVGQTIQTGASASVELQSPLTLDGGTLNAGTLVTNGMLDFVRGAVGITGTGGLTVGAGGPLGDTLNLVAGRTVNVTNVTTVAAGGMVVVGDGRLNSAGGITNSGEIRFPLGAAGRITGGTVTNQALIRGDGRIDNNLTNAAAGELRATDGERLLLAGASNTNDGRINLVNGGTVEFTAALTNSVTGRIAGRGTLITGGTLTNNGQIATTAGFSDILGPVTNNNDILITGGGTTTFYNPITNAAAGDIFVAANSAVVFLGAVTGAGTLSGSGTKYFSDGSSTLLALDSPGSSVVEQPAQVTTGYVREESLDVRGEMTIVPNGSNAATSRVETLAVSGRLDLTNNKLIAADAALGGWTGGGYSGVTGLVDAGRGNAGNAQWDGTSGIVTSDTRAIGSSDLTSIGVVTAGQLGRTTFGGLSVASSDVLVMFTWGGDANLDGKINIDDYGRIDGSVGQSESVFGWLNGDFNYDGKINIDDYGIIDGNINRQGAAFPTSGAPVKSSTAAFGELSGAVPEPSMTTLLFASLTCLTKRYRRVL